MLAAFDDYDRGIGRFAASRHFASDLRGMLHCQGGIRKHLADVILEYRWSVPVVKNSSVAWAPKIESSDQLRGSTQHMTPGTEWAKCHALPGSSRAGDGKQVRAQPRNKTPAAQFRSRDVQREESAAAISTNRWSLG
jgi:hypothetical protein